MNALSLSAAKYLAFGRIALSEQRMLLGELWARAFIYLILMSIFSRLWHAVGQAGMPGSYSHADVVWYLAATEWIAIGVPLAHLPIEDEVCRGDVAYAVLRPASYLGSLYALTLGRLGLRLLALGLVGFALGVWLSDGRLPSAAALASTALLGAAAALVLSALYVLIGVCSFWLGDVVPVYWVVQKLLFVLGGLMLPLELYPRFLRTLAAFTPFPSILNGPASMLLGGTHPSPLAIALQLALWLSLIVGATALALRRALNTLTLNGG